MQFLHSQILCFRPTKKNKRMRRKNTLCFMLLVVPLLVCCQTPPTKAFARFYLKTPSALVQRTNFTALYHLIRRGQNWPDPQATDMKEVKLRPILGDYVSSFLSTKKPQNFGTILGDSISEGELLKTMPSSLKAIDFSVPKTSRRRRTRSKTQSLFRLWLWNISYCPVLYRWTDLGKYVWPRYMKIGFCPKKSCSYPAGMTCQPSRKDAKVKVLLWYCSRSKKCSWKVYNENITTKCQCSCSV